MITAQDIQEKAFERAVKGYNMGQVDEFLDELAAEFTALAKENASLKGKLRVLVQKVDEYRQTEDSMRLALLSAQKMSAQIEGEAREKADATVAEAQEKADATVAEAQDYANRVTKAAADSIANEEAKLEEAKKATDRFFEHMRAVCEKQIEFYAKLSQMTLVGGSEPAPAPAPAQPEPVTTAKRRNTKRAKEQEVEETVRSIEASANEAALAEPEELEELEVDPDLPEEEEEPTRLYAGGAQPQKKKRSFDDFSFDDDI